MLRLLADENFPAVAVKALRAAGHDVSWIGTTTPGASDEDVLSKARLEHRILLTFDKDFAQLVFAAGQPASSGIILFRIAPRSAETIARTATAVIESRTDWAGHFSVVEETRIRMTKLPEPRK